MDTRIEVVERTLGTVEQHLCGLNKESLENKQLLSTLSKEVLETKQQLDDIKGMLAMLCKGKSPEEGSAANQSSPDLGTSTVTPIATSGGRRIVAVDDIQIAAKKVELPNFNGNDPLSWVHRVEQYFRIHETPEHMKVTLAMVCMEGHALYWMGWLQDRRELLTWEEIREEVLASFAGLKASSPYEALASTRQMGTVEEYIREFIAKSAQVKGWPEDSFVGMFLNGLRVNIRAKICTHETCDLTKP